MIRRAILVLGMHRSGTSALTGLLVRLGACAPKTLMKPTQHNPLGFWESDALFAYHESLLRRAGSDWDEWTRVNLDGIDAAAIARLVGECRELVRQEFGEATLFVVKDPRICRVVPFWLRVLADEGVEPTAAIVVRNPLEVAASLARRDHLGLEHALLLWLRHMLDADRDTRSITRSFVRYEDLLLDWKPAVRRLFEDIKLDWPGGPDTSDAEIAGFLRSDLRHHVIGIEQLAVGDPLQEWVRRTDTALRCLLSDDVESARDALRRLDEVRGDVDRFSEAFGPIFGDMRRADRSRTAHLEVELRQQVSNLEGQSDQLRRHVSNLEAEVARLHECASRLETELAHLRSRALGLEAERDRLAQQLTQARSDSASVVASLSERLEASEKHALALLESRSWRWTAPLRAAFRIWLNMSARRPQ